MLFGSKSGQKPKENQFSDDEIRGVFERITRTDLDILGLLEKRNIGLVDLAVAAGTSRPVTETRDSLERLGSMGLVLADEQARYSHDAEALHEVVTRAPDALFSPE